MKAYFEHPGKVAEAGRRFRHVMAITLDPASHYREGIIRCVTSRQGEVWKHSSHDRSELHTVRGSSLEHFDIGERLKIKNEDEIVRELAGEDGDFIGLEDPDIWIDEKTGLKHVYFTIPIRSKTRTHHKQIHLGHAVGRDLASLEMTVPALTDASDTVGAKGAKEVSIAPVNKQGVRLNLFEAGLEDENGWASIVQVGVAEDMGKPWQYGEIAFDPREHHIPWIGGHASPAPLFSKNFMDVGEGKALGLMNGREANRKVGGKIKYEIFSVGLFIYNYEIGKIEWVSPEPLIRDSEARIITFASQFVEQGEGSGILYAHVDDSFVRAYTLNAESIKPLLP